MKIFISPTEIAGYYGNLARGFQELGVNYQFVTFNNHQFAYDHKSKRSLALNLYDAILKFRTQNYIHPLLRKFLAIPERFVLIIWGIWTILTHDVFIFGFGDSLFIRTNFDLKIIKFLGKKIILNLAHGSEARPPYIDGAYQSFNGNKHLSTCELEQLSRVKFKKINRLLQYSTLVVGAPFSSTQYIGNQMINLFNLGLPCDWPIPDKRPEISPKKSEIQSIQTCRILHSPSHPAAKGSPIVLQAIENLKNKGFNIELVLVHGKPHSVVLSEIQLCDFVVDQLYSDTPMAGFAAESAWFGKPAVVGGYGLEKLRKFIPDELWPPSKICLPHEVEKAIEEMILDINGRLELGQQAQKFVREKWSAAKVAEKYLRLIRNDIPEEWWLDPRKVNYLEGAGQAAARTKENIKNMVTEYGIQSLQLAHRPDLEKAFLEFAEIERPN